MINNTLKEQIISRIKSLYNVCTIYLFGSYAYGTPDSSSDLDIAVILEKVDSNVNASARIWDVLKDINMPKDVIVASKDEFDFYKNEPGSLFRTIAEKGLLISES